MWKTILRALGQVVMIVCMGHQLLANDSLRFDLQGTIQFRNYNSSSGLPGEIIKVISQDKQGLIWLGVEYEGLVSFDGRNFDTYKHRKDNDSTISSNLVKCIVDDGEGSLWIGTENGLNRKRLSAHEYSLNNFGRYFSHDTTGLPSNDIISLLIDSKNRLLVGTSEGLCIKQNGFFREIELGKKRRIQDLVEIRGGKFLIATDEGLLQLDAELSLVREWNKGSTPEVANWNINTLAEDSHQDIWVGTRGGIYILSGDMQRWLPINSLVTNQQELRSVGINKILRDEKGRMWVGSISEGLFVLDREAKGWRYYDPKHLETGGFHGFQIRSILKGKDGAIWIGTKNMGFYSYQRESETFDLHKAYQNGLNDNCVLSLAEDSKGRLYLGTLHSGIDVFDPQTGRFEYFKHDRKNENSLLNDRVEAIDIDESGVVWIGTVEGVSVFDPNLHLFDNYQMPSVRALKIDHNGTVWIGTREGLWYCKNLSREFKPFEYHEEEVFLDNGIYTMLVGSDNHLWIGTANDGLLEYVPESGRLTFYSDSTNELILDAQHIRAMYEDKSGVLWVGTKQKGLYRLDRENSRVTNLSYDAIGGSVFGIQSDSSGDLWLATNDGILKYSTSYSYLVSFGKQHGLQAESFIHSSNFASKSGKLYFGGNSGLNSFYPEKVSKSRQSSTVSLKSILTTGSKAIYNEKEETYSFHYGDHLLFEFFLSNYTSPKENSFYYKLKEVDDDWIDSKYRSQISYANLQPSDYTLLIRGVNTDQSWSENIEKVNFEVLPPWWRSVFAKVIYSLLVFALLYAVYQILSFRSKKMHELQVLNLEKEQSEKLTQMKLRFFTNISHELRTPLTLMLPSAEKIEALSTGDSQLKKDSQVVMRSVRTLMTLIDELIQFRRIEEGKMAFIPQKVDLKNAFEDLFHEFWPLATEKNIDYQISVDSACEYGFLDLGILRKIVRNLISNAMKYTEPGGVVKLSATLERKPVLDSEDWRYVKIVVEDTGIGISAEALDHIFDRFYRSEDTSFAKGSGIGLDLVKSLVDLHEGEIEVVSKYGEGSAFSVFLPIERQRLEEEAQQTVEDLVEDIDQQAVPVSFEPLEVGEERPHVLIVEDDAEILEMLRGLFGEKYKVSLALDGAEGLEKALDYPQPNLIISDVMMPVLDGISFCQQLKGSYKTSHIPVILLTAKSTIADEVKGHEAGANIYMNKPFYPKVLRAKVESLLENQKLVRTHFSKEFQLNPVKYELPKTEKDLLQSCMDAIEKNMSNQGFGVEELSKEVGMSRTHLFRKLKFLVDLGPLELIYSVRLKRAEQLLVESDYTIAEIAYQTGFSSPNSFSTTFKKHYKLSPREFAKNAPAKSSQ